MITRATTWNLGTFAAGVALLLAGSQVFDAPDWDVPISLIMAAFTWMTASWSFDVLVHRRWRWWPLMILATWWTIDGCYAVYWSLRDPVALDLMREANWPASLSLYLACGLIWSQDVQQTLADALKTASKLLQRGW